MRAGLVDLLPTQELGKLDAKGVQCPSVPSETNHFPGHAQARTVQLK